MAAPNFRHFFAMQHAIFQESIHVLTHYFSNPFGVLIFPGIVFHPLPDVI
jgi:hypothetical protein